MKYLFVFLLVTFAFVGHSQNIDEEEPSSPVNLGLGLGLGYGGTGLRLSALPIKNVSLFGAAGYNLVKVGFNFGGAIRLLPDKRVTPTLVGMYGYNAVIVVQGAEEFNKTYYGPSF